MYNACLLFAAFVFPLIPAVFCFTNVAKNLKSLRKNAAETNGIDSPMNRETRRQEYPMYVLCLIMFAAFILAWFPYSSFVTMSMFKHAPSQRLFDIAAILAKSSSFYNPIIYAFAYKEFRRKVKNIFRRKKRQGKERFELKTETWNSYKPAFLFHKNN